MNKNRNIFVVKEYFNTTLTSIYSNIKKFFERLEQNEKFKDEINNLIHEHEIYLNKTIVKQFYKFIENCMNEINLRIEKKRINSEMYKKNKTQLDIIKDYIQKNKNNLLISSENNKINLISDNKNNLLNKKRNNSHSNSSSSSKNIKNKKKFYRYFCYICKCKITEDSTHFFYHNLCKKCGDYNYNYRSIQIDMSNRIAIVTGGRVNIGFQAALKLLSYNCKVLVTSRFPKDTLRKFKEESNYSKFKENLLIYPIDFRVFESTVKFVQFINKNFPYIDVLINNASQTNRRTAEYYSYLIPVETKKLSEEDEKRIIKNDYISIDNNIFNNNNKLLTSENNLSLIKKNMHYLEKEILPLSFITSQIKILDEKKQPKCDLKDKDGRPFDFSEGKSSFTMQIDEISFQEFTEVQIINAWTPYYLISKLFPLFLKSKFPEKFIINVTSMEGNFFFKFSDKSSKHVHTNMAKASVNMITRTCGKYFKQFGIYLNSVDPGKISVSREINKLLNEENEEEFEREFLRTALDDVDGGMRILQPVIEGIKNKNYFAGALLHDYKEIEW